MGLTHRDRAMEVTVYYVYCTVQQNMLGAYLGNASMYSVPLARG